MNIGKDIRDKLTLEKMEMWDKMNDVLDVRYEGNVYETVCCYEMAIDVSTRVAEAIGEDVIKLFKFDEETFSYRV